MARSGDSHTLHLRQIGWDYWDPIGIRRPNSVAWREGAADEYDTYLRHVFDELRAGISEEEAANYLDEIASEHMGLGPLTDTGHAASVRTVQAISEYGCASPSRA